MTEKEIHKAIKSGKFFHDSLSYYYKEYVQSYQDRTKSILLLITCLAIFGTSVRNVVDMFPIKRQFTLVKMTSKEAEEFSIMKKLDNKGDKKISTENLLSKYLVAEYTRRYENYDISNTEEYKRFIKNSSSRSVYIAYKDKLSANISEAANNTHIKKTVEIKNVSLKKMSSEDNFIKEADIIFDIVETDSGAIVSSKKRMVSVQFSLANIKMSLNKLIPFGFSVTKYSINW